VESVNIAIGFGVMVVEVEMVMSVKWKLEVTSLNKGTVLAACRMVG
jgi:ABC-type uncharacterized transport system ATPase subunit